MILRFFVLIALFISLSYGANCNKSINISTKDSTPLYEILHQLANQCHISFIVEDDLTLLKLKKPYKTLYIRSSSLRKTLKLIFDDEFYYSFKDGVLHVSYLSSKIFKINYIASDRIVDSSTSITSDSALSSDEDSGQKNNGVNININIKHRFNFYKDIKKDIEKILYEYDQISTVSGVNKKTAKVNAMLTINDKTGSIYIRASKKQLKQIEQYINSIKANLTKQVLIDINIYQVRLENEHKTGIDWSQISDLQNIQGSINYGVNLSPTSTAAQNNGMSVAKNVNINSLLAFISTYGKTKSVSNPRVLAINNQPAIYSIGKKIYYKLSSSTEKTKSDSTSTTTKAEKIESVFSGLILNITPAISKNGNIVLKINNSITNIVNGSSSSVVSKISSRTMPPDMEKQELSTVIEAKNKHKVVLGGLMSTSNKGGNRGIRWLKDIPIFGSIFGADSEEKATLELVIVITPKIINLADEQNQTTFIK